MSGKPFTPDDIDIRAGQIIAALRKKQGLSQKAVADKLGITFQQLQKYETAGNRISVSRFYHILKVLDVSFDSIFTELGTNPLYDAQMRRAIDRMGCLLESDRKMIYKLIDRLSVNSGVQIN